MSHRRYLRDARTHRIDSSSRPSRHRSDPGHFASSTRTVCGPKAQLVPCPSSLTSKIQYPSFPTIVDTRALEDCSPLESAMWQRSLLSVPWPKLCSVCPMRQLGCDGSRAKQQARGAAVTQRRNLLFTCARPGIPREAAGGASSVGVGGCLTKRTQTWCIVLRPLQGPTTLAFHGYLTQSWS